jgi:stage III sporulation protein AE
VFSGILSLRALLASGADNLALKGLKFSAARLIPIAGGMISESLKTVIATVGYIKSVTGIGGVVFIIYTVAIPLCAVITSKLCLFLLSAVAKSANLEKSASLFDGLQGCLNILSALLLGVSVSFIISIGLFIKITVSL